MMGGDFDHRWTQTEEAIGALKELWTQDQAEFHGKYYNFPPVYMYPKPVQQPHPPVLLGGNARNVLRRVVRYGRRLAAPTEPRRPRSRTAASNWTPWLLSGAATRRR